MPSQVKMCGIISWRLFDKFLFKDSLSPFRVEGKKDIGVELDIFVGSGWKEKA